MNSPEDIPQTKDVCHAKHRWLKWAAALLVSLMVAFLSVVGFAWGRADAAADKATEAKSVADVVNAKYDTAIPFIRDGIQQINKRLDDLAKEKH